MTPRDDPAWPPADAGAFVGSDRFAALVLDVATDLQRRYVAMDFVGATGLVWDWFARKARRSRRWFAGRHPRFENEGHLRAYLRQALWRTAANELRRERRRHYRLEPLPLDGEPACAGGDQSLRLDMREQVEALPIPLNVVVEAIVFAERTVDDVARELGVSPRKIASMFELGIGCLESTSSSEGSSEQPG